MEEHDRDWHVVQERVADHMTHKKRRKQNRKTPWDRLIDKILFWAAEFKWQLSSQMQCIACFYNVANAIYWFSI